MRTIIHRFLEVIHDKPVSIRHDELLNKYTTVQTNDNSKIGLRSKGKEFRLKKSARVNHLQAEKFKEEILSLDSEYANKYGGDVHEAAISKATRAIEEIVGVEYLCELLDLTKEENYNFKYDELRPDALESYYEKSLETSLKFLLKNGQVKIEADQGNLARKDLGAYFTPSEVSTFVIENSLAKKLNIIENQIKKAGIKTPEALKIFESYLNLKIIDPTVGGGSFLKAAFKEYCSPKRLNFINSFLAVSPGTNFDWLKKQGAFEKHVLCHNLYGIDYDYKALSVASQTLTLEAINYITPEEKLPLLIGKNLKSGNTFVSWIGFKEQWKNLPSKQVAELLKLRKKSLATGLASDTKKELELRTEIIKEFKDNKINLEMLNPFSWQLEFPELYFNDNGVAKEDFGFDVVVGNPPWECLKPYEQEFAQKNFDEVPTGKNAKKIFEKYFAEKLKNKDIQSKYDEYVELKTLSSIYVEKLKHYNLMSPTYDEVGGGNGDLNTYKLASEIYMNNVKSDGCFGVIIPDGICGDKGTRDLRLNFLANGLESLVSFNKRNDVFPDATQAFAILCGNKNKTDNFFKIISDLKSKSELKNAPDKMIKYFDHILLNSPLETKPILSLESDQEALLLNKYFQYRSFNEIDNGRINPYRELDTTNDLYLAQSIKSKGYAICKGENMGRFKAPTGELYPLDYPRLCSSKKWHKSLGEIRVAWRNIAGLNDPRRMYSCVMTKNIACFHSLNVIKGFKTEDEAYFYTAILNSFAYEFLIKIQSKNNNMSIFFIKLNPIYEFDAKSEYCKNIAKLSMKLHSKYSEDVEIELEARVADMYGFSFDEFKTILHKFDRVEEDYKKKVLDSFVHLNSAKAKAVA